MSKEIEDQAATFSTFPETEPLFEVTPPWARILLALFGALVAFGMAVLIFGRVEVHGRGRGILQPRAGVRVLQAQTAGIIQEVHVRNGEAVAQGASLLSLDVLPLHSSLLET